MPKILVFGAKGQLGKELQGIISSASFLTRAEVDITEENSVKIIIESNKPDFIINCTAYTAVDLAESEEEKAYNINEKSVSNLATICYQKKIRLIHISTDFVYSAEINTPLVESTETNPLSIYGKSKLAGEAAILKSNCNSIILRTSWLYSAHGNNFVNTMIRLGENRDELSVVWDQLGTPTWTYDLAQSIVHIIEKFPSFEGCEVYHYSNEGVASWYDFACEIMNLKEISCKVKPILSEEYPTPAARPHYSVMDKSKIKNAFSLIIPHWKESLHKCLQELK